MDSFDNDRDGSLSQAEFDVYSGSMASADSNGDGRVSASEFLRFVDVHAVDVSFDSVDTDGDTQISSTEFVNYFFDNCGNATVTGTSRCKVTSFIEQHFDMH